MSNDEAARTVRTFVRRHIDLSRVSSALCRTA